ncbi:unnamed protein product [Onchocerca flexuosa]|uniref:Uncharacterized protein n=1 Tax=Onchocerca flexuosa TaxID=387005 RepID=A0A183HSD4_9BILA|nr:unnamed protein product [Onchocerca flexuosa]
MHSRMSRLRRSLSRGSLFNGLSKSQLSLVDLPTLHQQSMLRNQDVKMASVFQSMHDNELFAGLLND